MPNEVDWMGQLEAPLGAKLRGQNSPVAIKRCLTEAYSSQNVDMRRMVYCTVCHVFFRVSIDHTLRRHSHNASTLRL